MKSCRISFMFVLLLIGGYAFAGQPGYKACAQIDADELRVTCVEIVREATRKYPEAVVDFIGYISDHNQKLKVLSETTDFVYPADALAACDFDFGNDASRLIRCLNSAGAKDTNYRTSRGAKKTASSGWVLGRGPQNAANSVRARCSGEAETEWIRLANGDQFNCSGQYCSNGECWKCRGSYYCVSKYKDYSEVR